MHLQTILNQKNITRYHLSKISGVPKTTILDICSGKSSLDRCSAKTVYQIARADSPGTRLHNGRSDDSGYYRKTRCKYHTSRR